MAEIRWSLAAERDIREIEEFIAREAPLRAIAFVDRLVLSTEKLETTPLLGRMVPEFQQPELRELIFHGYRVVYLHQPREVTILRVVHGARDLASLVERELWDLA